MSGARGSVPAVTEGITWLAETDSRLSALVFARGVPPEGPAAHPVRDPGPGA